MCAGLEEELCKMSPEQLVSSNLICPAPQKNPRRKGSHDLALRNVVRPARCAALAGQIEKGAKFLGVLRKIWKVYMTSRSSRF